jgi:WD40 repeat protein
VVGFLAKSGSRLHQGVAVTNDSLAQIIVFRTAAPSERITVWGCSDVISLALSPDRRWLAAGIVKGAVGIGIFGARSGNKVRHLPANRDSSFHTQVAFSPDGQWLVTGGASDYRFWEVGSWVPGPVIGRDNPEFVDGPAAFSRDGRIVTMAHSLDQILLFDIANRRKLVILTAQQPKALRQLCFDPDGTQLAAATADHAIQLWDLRAIRPRRGGPRFQRFACPICRWSTIRGRLAGQHSAGDVVVRCVRRFAASSAFPLSQECLPADIE